jgi:hypothetical protein
MRPLRLPGLGQFTRREKKISILFERAAQVPRKPHIVDRVDG